MAEEQQSVKVPRVKLGTQGLEVSKLGFGCMGLSGIYNDPVPDDVGFYIIMHAFARGITFFDTSDIYGPETNEILVGKVSKLGFGYMGLTGMYNDPVPDDVGISIIKHAFVRGITFFDTSDIYGPETNEILVGKALKQLPREKVQLATKFGIVEMDIAAGNTINGTPEYVRALRRLDVEYIDLYYQHMVDPKTHQ